jgi:hypothetical protein
VGVSSVLAGSVFLEKKIFILVKYFSILEKYCAIMKKYASILEKYSSILEENLPKWNNIKGIFSILVKYFAILENLGMMLDLPKWRKYFFGCTSFQI